MTSVAELTERDELLTEGIDDPNLFCDAYLGHKLWRKQRDIINSIATKRQTAVKACHSSGKTFLAADAALWWLARYQDGQVVTTAPTDLQVTTLLWGEIRSTVLTSLYPYPVPNLKSLTLGPKRFALGFSTSVTQQNEGVKFQGFHSGHILIILDEAPGVHPKIWEAIKGIQAGGLVSILALGNPVINSGPFYDCFEKNRAGWETFTISAFDTPNLIGLTLEDLRRWQREGSDELDNNSRSYLTTRRWVLDMATEYGEDHPLYQSRVLGLFPEQSADSLISLAWCEAARNREAAPTTDKVIAGLDVAGPGEDETVLTLRDGNNILLIKSWPVEDPRGEVIAELKPYKDKLSSINVDSNGVGWGMYTHLKGEGFPAVPVNVGEATRDPDKFANLKAELYWGLRLRLQQGDMTGLIDDKTIGQLSGIRYGLNPRGQIFIEKKEDARKRGVKSPDRAESIMLAFARPLKSGANLLEWMSNQLAGMKK